MGQTADLSYRADIDGMRAIAVTAVVLFHAVPSALPSGYVGVDVFFVISGYLIGSIIFTSVRAGRFSFAEFYARRARRILPALVAVVTFVSVLAIWFFGRQEMLEFAGQAGFALIGISNFYFWEHTDYFATASEYEPLLMTWSLGVEEQFYVVFPFFVIALGWLSRSLRLITVCLSFLALFALSLYITRTDPISAFYLLPARAWELLAGAGLAILRVELKAPTLRAGLAADALGYLSAAGLIASCFVYDGNTPFPGAAALLPVLSAVGLIEARHSLINRRILSARPMVALGKISYSWYLWHWPLMALVRRAADFEPSARDMLAVAAASLLISVLSWRFIEQPFRHSTLPARQTLLRYAVVLVGAVALPAVYKVSGGLPQRLSAEALLAEDIKAEGRGDCLVPFGSSKPLQTADCVPESATIALLGDSHASSFAPGLISSANEFGLEVAQFNKSACLSQLGFGNIDSDRPDHSQECATFMRAAVDHVIASPDIDEVWVSSYWRDNGSRFRANNSEGTLVPPAQAIPEGLTRLHDEVTEAGKRLVIVGDIPQLEFEPIGHLVGNTLPLRHAVSTQIDGSERATGGVVPPTSEFLSTRDMMMSIAEELDVPFFDPSLQLCDGDLCRFVDDAAPIYFDKHHLTEYGSRLIDWSEPLGAYRIGQQ